MNRPNQERILSGWGNQCRGNANSAGTHDAPIPGMVTSRRQPRPVKKVVPERTLPSAKALKAAAREAAATAAALAKRKEEKEDRRRQRKEEKNQEREKERDRSRSPRSRSQQRKSRSSSSSPSPDSDVADTAEAKQEQRARHRDDEEERLRIETDARFRAAQEEREARQREETQLAEERRKKDERSKLERKKKLKGAFATGDSDEEDEGEKRRRELAERLKKQTRTEALSVAGISSLVLQKPEASNWTNPLAGPASSSSLDLAIPSNGLPSKDAVSIRSNMADPSGSRNFTAGEVAANYKLLSEMKRKFRRSEFGGTGSEVKERGRARSRSRGRDRARSHDARYDSVWIKPGSKD